MASWGEDDKKTSISEDDLEDNYYMILNVPKDVCILFFVVGTMCHLNELIY